MVLIDSLLGFQWQEAAVWFSHIPNSAEFMSAIYLTALPQILIVIVALCLIKRIDELGEFLLTGIFGSLLCITVWFFLPSFGASSFYSLPDEVLARMPIVVGPAYGQDLVKLSAEGLKIMTPDRTLGLVGFPSFHIVMAAMCVVFTRPFKKLWVFFVILDALMIPSTIIQGGHHLIDVFGGMAVFIAAYAAAKTLINRINARADLIDVPIAPAGKISETVSDAL